MQQRELQGEVGLRGQAPALGMEAERIPSLSSMQTERLPL